jgi:hypothetical protein
MHRTIQWVVVAALMVGIPSGLAAPTIFTEDFDGPLPAHWERRGGVDVGQSRTLESADVLRSTPDDQGMAGIRTSDVPLTRNGRLTVRFYDAGQGCGDSKEVEQMLHVTQTGVPSQAIVAVGVNTITSDCFYVVRQNLDLDSSGVKRAVGWHTLSIEWRNLRATMAIDNQTVFDRNYPYIPDHIALGDHWRHGGTGWAEFEDLAMEDVGRSDNPPTEYMSEESDDDTTVTLPGTPLILVAALLAVVAARRRRR